MRKQCDQLQKVEYSQNKCCLKIMPWGCLPTGARGSRRMVKDTGRGVLNPLKIEIMAGPEADAQFHFTGIKKYFNSYTLTGRMNCVLATWEVLLLIGLILQVKVLLAESSISRSRLPLHITVPYPEKRLNINSMSWYYTQFTIIMSLEKIIIMPWKARVRGGEGLSWNKNQLKRHKSE